MSETTKRVLFVSVFVALVGLTVSIFSKELLQSDQHIAPPAVQPNESGIGADPIVSGAIGKYMFAAMTGDGASLEQSITSVPKDYYDNLNRCLEESGEIDRRLREEHGLIEIRRGVSKDLRDESNYSVVHFAKKIHQDLNTQYGIINVRSHNDHAVAKIEYGPDVFLRYGTTLLLTKTRDGWKVFSNTPRVSLDQDNPYFALSGCELE